MISLVCKHMNLRLALMSYWSILCVLITLFLESKRIKLIIFKTINNNKNWLFNSMLLYIWVIIERIIDISIGSWTIRFFYEEVLNLIQFYKIMDQENWKIMHNELLSFNSVNVSWFEIHLGFFCGLYERIFWAWSIYEHFA